MFQISIVHLYILNNKAVAEIPIWFRQMPWSRYLSLSDWDLTWWGHLEEIGSEPTNPACLFFHLHLAGLVAAVHLFLFPSFFNCAYRQRDKSSNCQDQKDFTHSEWILHQDLRNIWLGTSKDFFLTERKLIMLWIMKEIVIKPYTVLPLGLQVHSGQEYRYLLESPMRE